MSTMKDVARLSGVSIATISNYINGTKNVGAVNKLKIDAAIKELNYVIDGTAQLLKKGENNKIGIILPSMNSFYNGIFEGLTEVITCEKYKIELIISSEDPKIETQSVERLINEKCSGIVIVTCQPNNIEFFRSLKNRNIPFILLEREVNVKEFNYIGFNNYKTIHKIVQSILKETPNILLVVGKEGYRTEDDCVEAFKDAFKEIGLEFKSDRVLRTRNSRGNSFYDTINFLQKNEANIDYIIASTTSIAKGIKAAIESNMNKENCRIISLGESIDEVFSPIDGFYNTPRSSYYLGLKGGEILISNIMSEDKLTVDREIIEDSSNLLDYFVNFVITKYVSNSIIENKKVVKVLILEDPLSGGLKSIIPHFEKHTGIKIHVETCLMNNYYEYLRNRITEEEAPDLFLIDVPWMGYFASKKLICNLDEYISSDKAYKNTFVQKLLKGFGEWEGNLYALPYSYTNQLLFYRKDIFEDVEIKKRFQDINGFPLKPPRNWVEFNVVAKFFTRSFNENSPVEYGTSLAVAYPQAVAPEFLLRLWSLGGDVFDKEGQVVIDSKFSKRAIENYCECFSYATPNAFINMPSDQVREFCEGKAAMVVTFFSYGSQMIHNSNLLEDDKIGFKIVPGKISALSGWSMCVNEKSKNKEAALKFLKWLCGPEVAIKRAFLEGQSSQEFVYESTELMNFYPWLKTALSSLEYSSKRSMPKINGEYPEPEKVIEDILGNMIYEILKQPQSFDDFLKHCKEKLKKLLYTDTY